LVVVSLSGHTDDPQIANTCAALGIPYVLLIQAAGANCWISARDLRRYCTAYQNARQVLFVSSENRNLLEANLGIDLSFAEVVDNPFAVRPDAAPPWPSTEHVWKLAVVGRIHFAFKSQDLILQVLRQSKWRSRRIHVILWGNDDGHLSQVRRLIKVYSLENLVTYGGFAPDIEALWSDHHALLLPSRVEGNPLALIEAMLCGRVPIVTDVGRATELVDDNYSGFVAPAATYNLIDEVLERAWQRRREWQIMGQRAAHAIRQRHSLTPAEDLADRILVANERTTQIQRSAA
jgi:glycosyltransferase involved in cell wall biosynthesis